MNAQVVRDVLFWCSVMNLGLAVCKVVWLMLNVVPCLALRIAG